MSEKYELEAVVDRTSLEGRADVVRRAWRRMVEEKFAGSEGPYPMIAEIYEDAVVFELGEQLKRQKYALDDDGAVAFGDVEDVVADVTIRTIGEEAERSGEDSEELELETASGSDAPDDEAELELSESVFPEPDDRILESLDDGAGWVWRVTMIRPGISKNRTRYSKEVLAEAAHLYEGVKAFDGHRIGSSRDSSPIGGTNPLVGWHENVTANPETGALESDFHISRAAPQMREAFLAAYEANRPDLIGFSHDISATVVEAVVDGQKVRDVRKITEAHSVDVVADPSAGGRLERLVASRQRQEGTEMSDQALESRPDGETDKVVETATVTEAVIRPGSALHRFTVRAVLDEVNLPKAARSTLESQILESGIVDEDQIRARVTETAQIWEQALAASGKPLPGQGARVEVGTEEREKIQAAVDGMIFGRDVDGIPAFRSVKEAYVAVTGRTQYDAGSEEDLNRWILAESIGAVPHAGVRVRESLTTASWAEVLGDSIARRMVAEYRADQFNTWRNIVSEIVPVNDFRTNRRTRVGGYDVLPVVAEGGAYTSLASPADEEATYAVTKKGGTEDYTLEMVANDDLGALRRIPQKLGRAAALTLYRAVWNDLIAANAVIYDAVALFAAGHGNTTATTPLDEAGITTLRNKMIAQQIAGETSGFVGLLPRFLVVPTALYVSAYKLARSEVAVVGAGESATTPNPHKGLEVIEVPTFTDANDWYLIADPASVPTIEVGFYQGRQDPELLVQDQPAVGSVFTNDVFTWKIRHIWGLTVLDYRGFQQATQI